MAQINQEERLFRIFHYFPGLTEIQQQQYRNLYNLYKYWNERVNVISRADFENIYLHHVLHSLSLARVCHFAEGQEIIDLGTGGGFPGIPLAIMFPNVKFTLVDAISKKTQVVFTIFKDLGLQNVEVEQCMAEEINHQYDFVVSRAVTNSLTLCNWSRSILKMGNRAELPNGILLLKGGDLNEELSAMNLQFHSLPISNFFHEPFFKEKFVVYIPL